MIGTYGTQIDNLFVSTWRNISDASLSQLHRIYIRCQNNVFFYINICYLYVAVAYCANPAIICYNSCQIQFPIKDNVAYKCMAFANQLIANVCKDADSNCCKIIT